MIVKHFKFHVKMDHIELFLQKTCFFALFQLWELCFGQKNYLKLKKSSKCFFHALKLFKPRNLMVLPYFYDKNSFLYVMSKFTYFREKTCFFPKNCQILPQMKKNFLENFSKKFLVTSICRMIILGVWNDL